MSALQHTLKPNFVRQELVNDAYEDALGAGTLESLYSVNGAVDTYPQTLGDGVVGLRRHFSQDGEMVLLTFPLSLAFGYGNALGEAESFLQHFDLLP